MSYLHTDTDVKDLYTDLFARKEFYWLKTWGHDDTKKKNSIIPRFLLDAGIQRGLNLNLTAYQTFVKNYINPHTPYKRLLMQWETGTGKTIGALSIAMNFIQQYRIENEIGSSEVGTVFIIGFSERVFKNELLRFPEFGFLLKTEKIELDKLKNKAALGDPIDIAQYQDMLSRIKKRLTNRKNNGFFKFYGYKAFVNRIFNVKNNKDIHAMTEDQILDSIKNGDITYNEDLIKQFKNSLIICDEIHNVYNSVEKNNWGIAIQAVLDHEPTCRAVFASATPLNNSPTEIIDLLNLLLPAEQRVNKDMFFIGDELKPQALDKIAKLSQGRTSFLQDSNPKYYPTMEIIGEPIKSIPYLKFIRCQMSEYQYATYKEVYTGTLSQDSQYITDFVLENPKGGIGLYQTNQIKIDLFNADQKWKYRIGIDYVDNKIVGHALNYKRLQKYSTKYARMLDEIFDIIHNDKGKIFIYHNVVHMSGVLFIEQVLN